MSNSPENPKSPAKSWPNFVGIGAMRSGTTWLDNELRKNPNIWMPPVKELHFFDCRDSTVATPSFKWRKHFKSRAVHTLRDLTRGTYSLSTFRWDFTYFTGNNSLSWYASLFERQAKLGYVTGKLRQLTLCFLHILSMIVISVNPNIKIIYILRDPIDRAWSHATKVLAKDKDRSIWLWGIANSWNFSGPKPATEGQTTSRQFACGKIVFSQTI